MLQQPASFDVFLAWYSIPGCADCRAVACTALNAMSSRSHVVVILTLVQRSEHSLGLEPKAKAGKLFMVDLAGSERLKKSLSIGMEPQMLSFKLIITVVGDFLA